MSADVCITIEITIVLSVGTWVRLSFTKEGIGIRVRRELDCLGDGICVRFDLQSTECLHLFFALDHNSFIGYCFNQDIT